MTRRLTTGAIALCCVVGAGSSAFAQTTVPDRPYRGLFGSRSEVDQGQRLEVTATLVQAYDDNLLAEFGSIAPGSPTVSGQFTMLQAGTQYKWANRSVALGLTGASAFRYYSRVGDVQTVSHVGAAGLSASLTRRTTLLLNQDAAYSPSYMFGLFSQLGEPGTGEGRAGAPDYALNDLQSYSYATNARLTHSLTRRTSISAAADYTLTDFLRNDTGRRDTTTRGIRTELSRNLGRQTSLRTGYSYRTGEFSANLGSSSEHGVGLSMDHRRVLSASRQASFSFGAGVSSLDTPPDGSGAPGGRLYRVLGDAAFTYQFARSWEARAAYRRGIAYIADLTEPVLVGGFTASVEGLLTRRLDLMAAAAYSSGESALLYSESTFDTYTANVRSRFGLTRSAAVYLEYLFYFYDFAGSSLLAPGMSPQLERHGIRAGLTLWVPAFRR
ncbi:MAG TPA: hypothetical protein VJ813_09210 [Vicinamibacterales bacterium]|nr:hypothetical protein [Vicinamibacterales bacterium]